MIEKNRLITIGIILGVILFAIGIFYVKSIYSNNPSEEIIKCIANNSILYVSSGCSHCINQKDRFGEEVDLLTIVDCFKDTEICVTEGITNVPTWVIDGKRIKGTYSIEELKNMTKC